MMRTSLIGNGEPVCRNEAVVLTSVSSIERSTLSSFKLNENNGLQTLERLYNAPPAVKEA